MEQVITLSQKSHCIELFQFHAWRQKRINELLHSIDPTLFDKKLSGSFSSLFIIFNHLVWAEKVWLGRVNHQTIATVKDSSPEGLMKDWIENQKFWNEFVNATTEAELNKPVKYYNTQGEAFENTLFEIVVHLIDHATYHIGQMMNAVRSFGIEPVSTNYIHYTRLKNESK